MATMTITVAVSCNGTTWSRTASIEVDTASMQDGNGLNGSLFGTEAMTTTGNGMHSYGGIAVGVFANKAKGSVGLMTISNSSGSFIQPCVTSYLPLIVYSGAGTGLTGAFKTGGTATALADQDIAVVTNTIVIGAQKTTGLVGLKVIS